MAAKPKNYYQEAIKALTSSQKLEMYALGKFGATKDQKNLVKANNKIEMDNLKSKKNTLDWTRPQSQLYNTQLDVTTGDVGTKVADLFDQVKDLRTKYNLPYHGATSSGNAGFGDYTLGMTLWDIANGKDYNTQIYQGLDESGQPLYVPGSKGSDHGGYGWQMFDSVSRWKNYGSTGQTKETLKREPKPVKGVPNMYQITHSYDAGHNDKATITDYFTKGTDGKYYFATSGRNHTDILNKSGGFGDLLKVAGIVAAIYTGGAALGAWGGAEAAVLTAESAITEAYLAGAISPEVASTALNGIYTSAGITGGTLATGGDLMAGLGDTVADLGGTVSNVTSGGNMDWLGDYIGGGDWGDISGEVLSDVVNSSSGIGEAMSPDWFTEMARQDVLDFGSTGAEALGQALSSATTDWTPISWTSKAIDAMTSAGLSADTAASITNLMSKMGVGGSKAVGFLKNLFGSGKAADTLGLLGQLYGNNQIANSTSDIIGDWLDEIKNSSGLTPAQRTGLGERAVELSNRDYLDPEFENLMAQYETRGEQADNFGGMLEQLYTNPLGMDVYNALKNDANMNTLRAQGARGNLQAGNLESDMLNSSIKAMMGLAQPMNQSWQTALQGQNVPINMINALNNADQTAWTGATHLGNLANSQQQALAGFIQNVAAPAELNTNPVATGYGALYGNQGRNAARNNSGFNLASLF
jgi:hypothetical protein